MLVCFLIVYLATITILQYANCYSYHILDELCENNATDIMLLKGEKSGCFLQSYRKTWKSNKTDCSLTVTTPPEERLMVCVLFAEFPEGCDNDKDVSLLFTNENEMMSFCGNISRHEVNSSSLRNCYMFSQSELTLSFLPVSKPPQFRLLLSTYRKGPCSEKEFTCASENMCIWPGYICDGFRNCYDNSDEPPDGAYANCIFKPKWLWIMFIGILPIVILSVCCIFVYIYLKEKRQLIKNREVLALCDTFNCSGIQVSSPNVAARMPYSWFCNECNKRLGKGVPQSLDRDTEREESTVISSLDTTPETVKSEESRVIKVI